MDLKDHILIAKQQLQNFEIEAKEEVNDDYAAAQILVLFLEDKPVSETDIVFLKKQSIDFAKVLALIGLQAIPGSSVALVVLQKAAEKHGFSIFPDPEKAPDIES